MTGMARDGPLRGLESIFGGGGRGRVRGGRCKARAGPVCLDGQGPGRVHPIGPGRSIPRLAMALHLWSAPDG